MGAAEVAGEGAGEQAHLEQVHGTGGGGLVLPTTTPGTPSRSAAAAAAFNNFACAAALALGQVEVTQIIAFAGWALVSDGRCDGLRAAADAPRKLHLAHARRAAIGMLCGLLFLRRVESTPTWEAHP